jgi:hypothetical protein
VTKHAEIFSALMAPFPDHQLKHRPGSGGRSLTYITAQTAANRLDEAVGPEGWDFALVPWGADQLIGTLTVRLPDGSVVSRSNVGGKADRQAEDDSAKSAASDCFKRCAALLGIGRYLYGDGVPGFVREEDAAYAPASRPAPPARRDDSTASRREPNAHGHAPQGQGPRGQHGDRPPTTGKALYAWTMKQVEEADKDLLKHLNAFGKREGFPYKMTEWTGEQVAQAYAEARSRLERAEQHYDPPGDDPGY